MKVDLIQFTGKGAPNEQWAAADLLIFTKSTRLNMTPTLLDQIAGWPLEKKLAELEYMAGTIPSSWEMVDYIFSVTAVSRAYTHQQVRTRAGSYAQQSMRVTNQSDFGFILPKKIANNWPAIDVIKGVCDFIKDAYSELRSMDIAAEDARSILPTNISTNIVCKFNLRTLAELTRSRSGGRTQDEYIDVVNGMMDAVLAVHPWAEKFFAPKGRDYFAEIEAFAAREFPDLQKRGELLKIVDKMRKEN